MNNIGGFLVMGLFGAFLGFSYFYGVTQEMILKEHVTQKDTGSVPCRKIEERTYDCTDPALYERIAREYIQQWHGGEPSQEGAANHGRYPQVFWATVSAYNSVPEQTDDTPCISADGTDICREHRNGRLVCAAELPFGTRLEIPGFGTCTVRDRTNPKYRGTVDVHFGGADTIDLAQQWGRKNLPVTIVSSP